MSKGWIKLHRITTEWEWYDDANTFRVFIHLLLKANHTPSKYRGQHVNSGDCITGFPALAEQTGLTVMQVRTVFKKLISTGEITVRKTNKFYNSFNS